MQWHTEWAFLNSLKHQWLSVLLQQSVNKVNSNGKKKISLNIIMQNCLKKYFLVIVKHHTNFIVKQNTMWHKIFAGGYFCRLAIFCVLRELIFADWRFFVSCGNLFLQLGQIGFSCWELIFAIFRKYSVPSIDHIVLIIIIIYSFIVRFLTC